MKKPNLVKSIMYNKMYMVTPMVYEKLKTCLDRVDKQALEKVNKPFFIPPPPGQPIEHVPPFQPPSPPRPPSSPEPYNPNVSGEMDWYDMPFLENPEPFDDPEEPKEEFKREPVKREQFPTPEYEEFGTQTNIPMTSEMSAQTDIARKPIMSEIQTQTIPQTRPLTFEMETQTDPIRKRIIPLRTSETQTDPIREPAFKQQLKKETKGVKKRNKKKESQIVPFQSEDRQLVPFVPQQTQIAPIRQTSQVSFNLPTPMDYRETERPIVFHPTFDQPMELEYQRQPELAELEYHRQPRLALPAPKEYPIAKRDLRTIQKYKKSPVNRSHLEHMGQPLRPMLEYEGISQPRQLLFEEKRLQTKTPGTITPYVHPGPRAIEMQVDNQPLAVSSRDVGLVHPRYTIEYPFDEPPGERISKRQYESEIVPPHKIIKHTYSSKKRKLNTQVLPTGTQELERFDDPNFGRWDFKKRSKSLERFEDPNFGRYGLKKRDINLAEPKKRFMCDRCGLSLSTRYNLIRHQERELKRFSKGGELKEPPEPAEPADFNIWAEEFKGKTKKRTSSQAEFKNKPSQKKKDEFDKWK